MIEHEQEGGPTIPPRTDFAHWCIVELLGHRRLAGFVQEVQVAGAGFLRLDIPATEGHEAQTQIISPGSVYALHPVNEVTARAVAASFRPEPVHRWELAAAKAPHALEEDSHADCTDPMCDHEL
jgi:hypothetical protein